MAPSQSQGQESANSAQQKLIVSTFDHFSALPSCVQPLRVRSFDRWVSGLRCLVHQGGHDFRFSRSSTSEFGKPTVLTDGDLLTTRCRPRAGCGLARVVSAAGHTS